MTRNDEKTERYKLQHLQMDDRVRWLSDQGERCDILQGWKISDRGNHTLIMRSGKTCMLSDVLARVRYGEELTF